MKTRAMTYLKHNMKFMLKLVVSEKYYFMNLGWLGQHRCFLCLTLFIGLTKKILIVKKNI